MSCSISGQWIKRRRGDYHVRDCVPPISLLCNTPLVHWMTKYLRDGRSPLPDFESVSKVMSSNKGKNTSPEIKFRMALRKEGLTGYRLHWKGAPGHPDVVFPGRRIAIFINGDFWHQCPICNLPLPKTHKEFWEEKLKRNVERDKEKIAELEVNGWKVFVFWEHEIKEDADYCVDQVKLYINNSKFNALKP
jgi:DNA mismatch endonuclease (patch repair protein)